MKTIKTYIYLFVILVIYACGSSKTEVTSEQLLELDLLVNNKNFEIISDKAYPHSIRSINRLQNLGLIRPGNSVSRINLSGNSNYLKVVGDSVYVELPYFGERQSNVAYNGSNSSISVENVMQNYKVEKNVDGNYFNISFDAKNQTETFSFSISVYPNLDTTIFLTSTSRFSIRYSGTSEPLQ
ncbi:DUF4251 domain-containing protein [Psychroserpens sp.]|uniref:DUF4251 domain-containing protein n=1 Tax=Psychroserpens sp. TaxID=2020870 RepID=UPI002B279EC6|nr:DUF4251 domain-containing protein [Psychroserpens sp.]